MIAKSIKWNLSTRGKLAMGEKWCEGKRSQCLKQRGAEAFWTGKVPEHMYNLLYGGPRQEYVTSSLDYAPHFRFFGEKIRLIEERIAERAGK